jgi:hypothetical protein
VRLIHYSEKPLGQLWSVTGQLVPEFQYQKPAGLWVSVEGEDDWKQWCEGAEFEVARLQVKNVIELKPDADILWLRTELQLDEFTKRYGMPGLMAKKFPDLFRSLVIDWSRVAKEYQGLVISPYQWSRRMDEFTSWYYGWDCASGCIWDVDAIERVTLATATPLDWAVT